ncbi:hypothetical protein GGH13_004816 [Coemansia sp. S155-1]|nr:hypothetical protein GGH13_004816 [Coemansia sp. S155-1]
MSSADLSILASAFFALVEFRAQRKLFDIQINSLSCPPGLAEKYSCCDKVVTPTTLILSMSVVLAEPKKACDKLLAALTTYHSK